MGNFKMGFIIFTMILMLLLVNCKTSEVMYMLTVELGAGTTGTPATGTYQYEQGAQVTYNYSLADGYKELAVTLDGAALAQTGSFTVTGNHTLKTSAEELFDIRGKWEQGKFNAKSWFMAAEFKGTMVSGPMICEIDTLPGKTSGEYTVNDLNVSFWIWYASDKLYFTGTVVSDNKMEGAWNITGGSSHGSSNKLPASGTWVLLRN